MGAVAGAAGVAAVGSCAAKTVSSPILVNHVGFVPTAAKFALVAGSEPIGFRLVDAGTSAQGLSGQFEPVTGDFGPFLVADFSGLQRPGTYVLQCPRGQSQPLIIAATVYVSAVAKCVDYFAQQRCGDSSRGYHRPCHLDDGRRSDDGRHQDVSGGWHDACDVRKWTGATIHGLLGLTGLLDRAGKWLDRDAVIDEIRWGNGYFLKMQDSQGFLMNYCGGDDGNGWTDNRVGTADDRVIHVEPADVTVQFLFVAAQARIGRLFRDADRAYAERCLDAGRRCWRWCVDRRNPQLAGSLAAGVIACAELHRASDLDAAQLAGVGYLGKLVALQSPPGSQIGGFFRTGGGSQEPYREIAHGNLPLLSLCAALERWRDHPGGKKWQESLDRHVQFLESMAARSAFGTVPYGLYDGADPGGNRRVESHWYRWFMRPGGQSKDGQWWVGINAHLASNGVGLCRASRILNRPSAAALGQRQLDWIMGCNPFNASTISDVGRNQPALFVTGEFRPATPVIPGGVMNGIGGTADDRPTLSPESYHTCEYWTPMVSYTMGLMAERMGE